MAGITRNARPTSAEYAPRAEREVTQLRDYIAQDSPFYARQFTERLIQSVERLTSMPRSGRMVPEAGHQDTIREVIFQGYRIVYRIRDEQHLLQIVTVLHSVDAAEAIRRIDTE